MLPDHLVTTYEAFSLLSGGRGAGFSSLNPISTADILAAADLIEPDDPLRFLRVIRAIDALFLTRMNEAQERKAAAAKKTKRRT